MTFAPHPTWMTWLEPYARADGFVKLQEKLAQEPTDQVYPPASLRYRALAQDPELLRVVILGQDPYHGPGQAMGLAFSVPDGQRVPPSLVNIYKEIELEGGRKAAGRSGDLSPWAAQGVLLLNTALSVHAGQAGSHHGWGWEAFTDGIIGELARRRTGLVFLLWGKPAQSKRALIPEGNGHLVLQAPHPSPLSAYRGFLGCGHFAAANDFLEHSGKPAIEW